jgi:ectoine hydroxylase-related dioxygenase (phytanoyl-CoA dioxygenase family)
MDELLVEIKRAGQEHSPDHAFNKENMIFYADLVRKSPWIQEFATQQRFIDLLKVLIGPGFWIRWDQAVGKYPGGTDFPWHQDNAYNRLLDMHYQFWIGITEMNERNGGLWLQPGSHKLGLLPHSEIGTHLSCDVKPCKEVFCKTEKGDLIVFSSMMLHYTSRNYSERERWAFVIEYMSTDFYDPLAKRPYFVAAENGERVADFRETYKGASDPRQRMKYLGAKTRDNVRAKAEGLFKRAGRLFGGDR